MRRLLILLTIIICATPVLSAPRWVPQTSPASQEINDVLFFDENTGFAVGNNRVLIKSTDGGRNWTSVIAEANNYNLNSIHFPNPTVNTLVGYAAGQDPAGNGFVLKTTDGGVTWPPIATQPAIRAIQDIFFFDQNRGWIVTLRDPATTIWRTDDGGTTWTDKVAGISDLGVDFYSVFFVDNINGWVVDEGAHIYNTIDGGENWTNQTPPGSSNDLLSIFFVNSIGWAVGANGTIYKTTDGGTTPWLQKTSGSGGSRLTSVHFINTLQGWAVGMGDTILKTTDGGETWTSEPGNISGDLKSVYFVDQYDGWAVGGGGGANSIILKYSTPIITSVTRQHPTAGAVSWDNQGALREITVNGKNFLSGASISFSGTGITFSNVTFVNTRQLKVNVSISPNATVGFRDVTVTNPDQSSYTLPNAFEIRSGSGSGMPTISSIVVDGAVAATSGQKLTKLNPSVTCNLNAADGLSQNTVSFKILIGDPVEYYFDYPGSVLTVNPNDSTKGNVQSVLQNLKNFSTSAVSDAFVALSTAKSLYLYAEDLNSNPVRQLYDTVYFEGKKAGENDITNILTSPNYNPTPANPVTIQFESRTFTGDLSVNIIGLTGIVNKLNATITLGTNKINFSGTDFNGGLLPAGIYLVYFTGSDVKGKGKIVIQR